MGRQRAGIQRPSTFSVFQLLCASLHGPGLLAGRPALPHRAGGALSSPQPCPSLGITHHAGIAAARGSNRLPSHPPASFHQDLVPQLQPWNRAIRASLYLSLQHTRKSFLVNYTRKRKVFSYCLWEASGWLSMTWYLLATVVKGKVRYRLVQVIELQQWTNNLSLIFCLIQKKKNLT